MPQVNLCQVWKGISTTLLKILKFDNINIVTVFPCGIKNGIEYKLDISVYTHTVHLDYETMEGQKITRNQEATAHRDSAMNLITFANVNHSSYPDWY